MNNSHTVMAILIDKRTDAAPEVQEVLTDFGCIISTRIGLHGIDECPEDGLLILHLYGEQSVINNLEQKLKDMSHVKVKKLELKFD